MKQLILVVMLVVIGGNILKNAEQYNSEHPLVYTAEAKEEPKIEPKVVMIEARINWTEERIEEEVKEQAKKYNIPFQEMWNTILCESGANTTIQSYYKKTYPPSVVLVGDTTREQSFGLAQIHLPDHPNVTMEQAQDPKFSIDFMAKNWYKVRWYCRNK